MLDRFSKKIHDKLFKVQPSCCDALCNIWPSCLARFAQVCPWFVLGKNRKPHNYSSFPRINLAPWCFQFYSDPKNPPKPHLKHHSQLQMIAEEDQSEFPPQASHSLSQLWPWSAVRWGQRLKLALQALTHWDMNQLWEAFTRKDCGKCHQYPWCYKPQELSHIIEASKKPETSEPLHSHQKAGEQLNGHSFSPCMSCTEKVALDCFSLPWAAPEWSMDNHTHFLISSFPLLLQKEPRLGWSKCNLTSLTAPQFSAELITASLSQLANKYSHYITPVNFRIHFSPNSSINHSQM